MSADSPPPSFVDTNIFVYAVADDDPTRKSIAEELLEQLAEVGALHTSTQVLQELYVVLTLKVRRKFTPAGALDYLDRIARSVTPTDYGLVRHAAELSSQHKLNFWDALIVAAAARSGALVLYTEDLQHGRTILGVTIMNPFRQK